tara:strand:+ start:137 stop:268 length:132 start_codon:yes stop_codon:yes gene_type:complete
MKNDLKDAVSDAVKKLLRWELRISLDAGDLAIAASVMVFLIML